MGETSSRKTGHDHADASRRALALPLAIDTAFLVVEVAGALLADSLALLADVVHVPHPQREPRAGAVRRLGRCPAG